MEVKASAPEGKEKGKEKMGLRAGGKLKGILSTKVAESEDERTGTRTQAVLPAIMTTGDNHCLYLPGNHMCVHGFVQSSAHCRIMLQSKTNLCEDSKYL